MECKSLTVKYFIVNVLPTGALYDCKPQWNFWSKTLKKMLPFVPPIGFPGSVVKNLPAVQETQEIWIRSLGWDDPLEEEMATHSSILALEISWAQDPGGLQSVVLQTVGHNWVNKKGKVPLTEGWIFSILIKEKSEPWVVVLTGPTHLSHCFCDCCCAAHAFVTLEAKRFLFMLSNPIIRSVNRKRSLHTGSSIRSSRFSVSSLYM